MIPADLAIFAQERVRQCAGRHAHDAPHALVICLACFVRALLAAEEAERERCAQVAEAHKAAHMPDYPHYQDGDEIAAAIRREDA